MFSIPYFTLVNIICGKEVIRELLGDDFTVKKLVAELQRLLTDETYTKEVLANYEHLSQLLGTQPAAATAASIITSKR
jgi:lipid-A-disaccharide synthase